MANWLNRYWRTDAGQTLSESYLGKRTRTRGGSPSWKRPSGLEPDAELFGLMSEREHRQ